MTIDKEGNFRHARKLEKGKDVVTIIPVTSDSAAKTNGIVPHPLCDKLCYIGGDYSNYTGGSKKKYFEAYMEQLWDWVESEDTHPMIQAIYRYLGKKTLIKDLVTSNILELDDSGKLAGRIKIQESSQTEANVRFIVQGISLPSEVWKNQELYQAYGRYYQKRAGEQKLCYATGKIEACSDKHPAKIRNSGDKAKIISGNDESGFTYRGRFTSKDQAVSVGYETSQKAHNALKWLIQKQGYTRDGSTILCWMVNREQPLWDIMKDSVNACNDLNEMDFDLMEEEEPSDLKQHDTGKYFAEKFHRAVNGYLSKFEMEDQVAIIALDAATTGRLSVVYYDEMNGRQYADAILNWQNHCQWRRNVSVEKSQDQKKRITCECTPSPREMALAAFGVQRSKWLEADPKLIKSTVQRLLPCITRKGLKIPVDIIKAAARRASMPQTMDPFIWYNEVLCVVCAMIRYNYEKEEEIMEEFLKDHIDDRNVLFGRLLAVYDYMEQRAMFEYDENGKVKEGRTTNAKRYWNAYSSRPAKTFQTIKQNLVSYEKKLNGYEQKKFEEWTSEIMAHLAANGFDNRGLSELYLPGYYLQMEDMKQAFQKKEQ